MSRLRLLYARVLAQTLRRVELSQHTGVAQVGGPGHLLPTGFQMDRHQSGVHELLQLLTGAGADARGLLRRESVAGAIRRCYFDEIVAQVGGADAIPWPAYA